MGLMEFLPLPPLNALQPGLPLRGASAPLWAAAAEGRRGDTKEHSRGNKYSQGAEAVRGKGRGFVNSVLLG